MTLDLLNGDPASASAGWVTVVSAGDRARGVEQPPRLRRLLVQLAVAGAIAALVVSFAGSIAIRRIAESQSVHDVARLTDVVAQSAVQPALTDEIVGPQSAVALADLDRLVRGSVLSDSLLRLKLWSADGTVVYSDEPRLVGMRFGLDEEAQDAFSDPQTVAAISDLSRPENLFERGQGKLLEVYRPIWTPSGQEYLLEAYYRYDLVGDRSSQLWRAFLGITLSSLAILLVLMIPIMAALLARARRAQVEREAILQRGLDASAEERRRIAAALHDGVVQELAAAAFAAAAVSESAASRGDTAHAAALDQVAATVRAGVGGLRTLVVDIYPPSLESAGLTATLRDLAVTPPVGRCGCGSRSMRTSPGDWTSSNNRRSSESSVSVCETRSSTRELARSSSRCRLGRRRRMARRPNVPRRRRAFSCPSQTTETASTPPRPCASRKTSRRRTSTWGCG